jgi:DNA polymerase-3 subunit beta
MEFEVVRENLNKALSIANKAISVKASLPILQNFLIEQDTGRLKITATDLDRSIVTWVGAKISGEGSVTIPAKPLVNFVSSLKDERVSGEVKKESLDLKTKSAKASFNGVESKDFPTVKYELSDNAFEINTDILKRSIDETYFSASNDDTRPAWTGILFTVVGEDLHIVSLDTFRMAKREISIKDSTQNFKDSFDKVIIPAKNMLEIIRLASGSETVKVDVQKDKSVVLFYLEDILFVSKILEGDFPDYNQVIPASNIVSVEISSDELLNAVKLASVFASERNAIRFSIKPTDKKLVILSDNVELGNNELEISLVSAKGEDLDIAFDAKYIVDYLNNVPSETIVMSCSGQSSPTMFVPKGRDDYLHIAVPLNPYW